MPEVRHVEVYDADDNWIGVTAWEIKNGDTVVVTIEGVMAEATPPPKRQAPE